MDNPTNDEISSFMEELEKISKKYGVAVHGCGCCGSPHLIKIPKDKLDGHYTHMGGDSISWRK